MANKRRIAAYTGLGILAVGVGGLFLTPGGRDIRNLWGNGTIQAVLSEPEQRKYNADNESNLKALYTALNLYHDSEGQFPQAAGWMDAIKGRLRASDMKAGEEEKKFHDPIVTDPNGFGYAMNDAASGKFNGDLKDKKEPLIYESTLTTRNAHGDPKKDGRKGGKAVSSDGTIVALP